MNHLSNKVTKQNLLGAFIQLHRKNENLSLSFTADIVKISKAYLSDIEKGKRIPQEYTLSQILKVLGVSLNRDESIALFLEDKLHELYKNYAYLNEAQESRIYEEDIFTDSNYEFSLGFLQFYLIKLMKEIRFSHNNEQAEICKKIITDNFELISQDDKNIFYDLCALEEISRANYNRALSYLNQGLKNPTSLTEAMINYHLCIVHQELNKLSSALIYCQKAYILFNKDFSFHRMLYTLIHEGNCYSRLHDYEIAENKYLKVLDNCSYDSSGDLQKTAYNNLSWNALKAKKYEDCIEYTKKAITLGSIFPDIYIYLPLCYYCLNEFILCKKETENNIIHFSKNSFHYWLLNAILCLLEKKWMDGVYNLDICLSMNLEYEMQILILQLICNILRQLKNYRLLAEYQDTLLNIII